MFAYCNNNPICFVDPSGKFLSSHVAYTFFDGDGSTEIFDLYYALKNSFEKAGLSLHHSVDSALASWGNVYRPLSSEYEYVTFLYSVETTLGTRYFTTYTYKGTKEAWFFSPNVLLGTLVLGLQDIASPATLLAHVHTHPDPGVGYHNDFPSYVSGIRGGDRIVFDLFNFPEMYVLPYKRCDGTPSIIVYSDRTTWCGNLW